MNTVDSVFTTGDPAKEVGEDGTETWQDTESKGRYWLILTRQSGNLEFYTLPDCQLRFKDKNFASAPRVIESGRFEGAEGRRGDVPLVQEINMFLLGPSSIPHLVVIIADQMIIYKYRSCQIRYSSEQPVLSGRFIKQTSKSRLIRHLSTNPDEKQKQRNNKGKQPFLSARLLAVNRYVYTLKSVYIDLG